MKKKTFDDFLGEKCPSERQTNNSPEGEDRWIEELDTAEVMEFAQEYGDEMYELGCVNTSNEATSLASNHN